MDLKIFDVEHGSCALLTCDDNTRLMIDAGHNVTGNWRPGEYLLGNNIRTLDMLTITNYDEDHVSGIENLLTSVDVRWLSRNKSVTSATLRDLKKEGGMGPGIKYLCRAIDQIFTGDGSAPKPRFAGLERRTFWCRYPQFTDENDLSLVNFLSCNGIGVMFPGDLERAGWEHLSQDAGFREAMSATSVLVAPHHGRVADVNRHFYREFFKKYFPNVYYVVISDKGYMHDTQQTIPLYREVAKGGPFRGETRRVLTTRKDNRIGFTFSNGSWSLY